MPDIEQATYLTTKPLKYILQILVVLCVVGTGGSSVRAGIPGPRVRTFTPNGYGGGAQNWDVTQDDDGLIFVANSVGVLRYDGTRWVKLPLPGNPTVRAVATAGGRLYAGGYGEFGFFEAAATVAPVWHSLSSGLSILDLNEEIWNIEVLDNGHVFFQSFGRLFHYDGQHLETISPPGVMMFARARGNELLVPVTGMGIFRWEVNDDFALLPGSEALGDRQVVGLIPVRKDLMVGTADAVLMIQNGALIPWSGRLNDELVGQKINRLQLLRDGTLAVGTITNGLYVFDPGDEALLRVDKTSGLGNNTVLAIFEGEAGNLWLGLDYGLDLVVRSPAISFVTGKDRPPGMIYTAVRYRGVAYFGTNQGLYRQKNTPGGYGYDLIPGTSGQVWELRETPGGLLCGHNDGTFLIRGNTVIRISDRSGGWMTVRVNEKDSLRLLQATYTGLQLLDFSGSEVTLHDVPGFNAPVRYLAWVGPQKLLAIHGSRGAFLLSLAQHNRRVTTVDTLYDPLLTQISAAQIREGMVLQGPQGRLLLRGDSLLPMATFRGVPLSDGGYYLKGNGSPVWFFAEPDRVKVFRGDRMINELPLQLRFPYPDVVPWTDDSWLFILDEGYSEVKLIPETPQQKSVIVNATHRRKNGWHPVEPTLETPVLAYADNDLHFAYALPVFDRSVRYRSRLLGYAGDWSGWTEAGEREFTNLPEGNYRFEVEANWFDGRSVVHFSVGPPWYRSGLAYVLYVLALLALVWMFYRLHLRRLKRQARQLEVVRRRELQRERIVTRNRELNTDVKRKSRQLADTTLALAKKNEMLLALKEELAKGKRKLPGSLDHRKINNLIDRNLNNEEDWSIFESHFNEVHAAFLKRLRKQFPELSGGELKLAAYLRMNLSSKEIAPLLHISLRGVENKRYRLRKKLALEGGNDLNRYLLEF